MIKAENVSISLPVHDRPIQIDVFVRANWMQRAKISIDGGEPILVEGRYAEEPHSKKIYHGEVPAGVHSCQVTVHHLKKNQGDWKLNECFVTNGDEHHGPNCTVLNSFDNPDEYPHNDINCQVIFSW